MKPGFEKDDRLESCPLYKVLTGIEAQQLTGVLTVSGENETFDFYFDKGLIVFAVPHVPRENMMLGKLITSREYCNDDQIRELLVTQEKEMLKIGRLAVQAGYITETELIRVLEDQTLLFLYIGLTLTSGVYHFHQSDTIHYDRRLYKPIHLAKIILAGTKILKSREWMQERLPDTGVPQKKAGFEIVPEGIKLTHSPKSNKVISLTAHQEAVYELIDGKRTIRSICDTVHCFEWFSRKALLDIQDSGLIVIDTRTASRSGKRKTGKHVDKKETANYLSFVAPAVKISAIVMLTALTIFFVSDHLSDYLALPLYNYEPAADTITADRAGEIRSAMVIFHLFEDRFPESLQEMADVFRVDLNLIRDGWNTPFAYHRFDSRYELRSFGSDRLDNTENDLIFSGHIRDFAFGSLFSASVEQGASNREQGE